MGILIEHYGGAFPLWLAPVQALVLPVSEKYQAYAEEVRDKLRLESLRVAADLRNEKLGYKIRSAQVNKIPYMLIVGDREVELGTVSVRSRLGGDQGSSGLDSFVAMVQDLIREKATQA